MIYVVFFIYANNVVFADLLGFRLDLCWVISGLKRLPVEYSIVVLCCEIVFLYFPCCKH